MTIRTANRIRGRLLTCLMVLAVMAIIGGAAVFIDAMGPDTAVVEQRIADRQAWEKGRTDEQRQKAAAWEAAVRDSHRNRGLVNLVLVFGSLMIIATCIRSSLASAHQISKQQSKPQHRPGSGFARVLRQTSFAFGGAIAAVIVVPILESVFVRGHGMYEGEQGMSALFTMIWFVVLLGICLVWSYLFLKRRSSSNNAGSSPAS